jgi:HEAT repeat protein
MFGQDLRQLQQTLHRKADGVQAKFSAVGEQLQELARKIKDTRGVDSAELLAEQAMLRATQQALADEVNHWRAQAREALRQPNDEALDKFLAELTATEDPTLRAKVEQIRVSRAAPQDEPAQLLRRAAHFQPGTPASRLIERARTEGDLRTPDPTARRRTAFEFANRTGIAQNDEVVQELEQFEGDPDSWVKEVATLTLIQMLRFRIKNLSQLEIVQAAVEHLRGVKHPAVVPVLIEALETTRTGFLSSAAGVVAGNNHRSRLTALVGLAEWHTREAQLAVRARLNDRDPEIRQAAADVLALRPGEWQ